VQRTGGEHDRFGSDGQRGLTHPGHHTGGGTVVGGDPLDVGRGDNAGPVIGGVLEVGDERRLLGADTAPHRAIPAGHLGASHDVARRLVDMPSQLSQSLLEQLCAR